MTDDSGFAELDARLPPLATPLPEFEGYLLWEGGEGFMPLVLQRTGPFVNGSVLSVAQSPTAIVAYYHEAFERVRSPERGLLYAEPYDCHAQPAKEVTVEAWIAAESGYRPCEGDCGILYQNDSGVPDPTRNRLSGSARLAFVYNVPTREVAIVVRDAETRAVVGVERVVVRPGHAHSLLIYPPSVTQMSGVPSEAR